MITAGFILLGSPLIGILVGVYCGSVLTGIGVGLTCIPVFVGIDWLITRFFSTQTVADDDRTILIGLRGGSQTSASFFLGIGSVDEEQTAFYYTKLGDGAIVLRQVSMEYVRIYEDCTLEQQPYAVTFHEEYLNNKWKQYFISDPSGDPRMDIHLPPGSVCHNFNI